MAKKITVETIRTLKKLQIEESIKGIEAYNSALDRSGKRKSLKEAYKRFDNANALREAVNKSILELNIDIRDI